MKKLYPAFLFFVFFCCRLQGQDIHFTQFYAAPLTLNPGYTGMFNGNIRAVLNYRNQWQSFAPYTTFAGSVDYNFGQRILKNDLFGAGISFFSDKAGDSQFSTTQGNISFAYIKTLGNKFKRSYLSVGFESGFAQRTINVANMTFGSQYNGYNYDPSISSGETMAYDNFSFVDLGAGITWLFVPKDRLNFYSGAAFHHVNSPNQSFGSEEDDLYMRSTYNFGAQIPLAEKFDIVPAVMVQMQGPHYEFTGGVNFKYYMLNRSSTQSAISFGGMHRMGISDEISYSSDATAVCVRYDYMGFSGGLSYDINISGLQDATNSLGGPELSLIYTAGLPHRDRKVDCPKF